MMKLKLPLLILIITLVSMNISLAASIGVSPGIVDFKNMLRGGYAERVVTISISADKPVITSVSKRGDIEDWINFSSTEFLVKQSEPYKLKMILQPPADIENGEYQGYVRVVTEGLGEVGAGQAGSIIKAAVDIIIKVTISDLEIEACRSTGFGVTSVEKGAPLEFTASVINDGNILINPLAIIDIWDQERENIVKFIEFDEESILPTVRETIKITIPTDDFEIGQYWADFSIPECGDASDVLTFDVMEPGSLRAEGILRKISNKVWVTLGETIPIYILFENTGQKQVTAKFKGKIERGNEIVKVLETEELEVPVGQTINFTLFFEPKDIGRHVASGRVFYDKKRTYESSSIINVILPEKKDVSFLPLVYVLIIAVIIFLVWKINREKKKKHRH